jgi:hypothetical protein
MPPGSQIGSPDIKAQITAELYVALERLDGDEELLIAGNWRDTLDDAAFSRCCVTTTPAGQRCTRCSDYYDSIQVPVDRFRPASAT